MVVPENIFVPEQKALELCKMLFFVRVRRSNVPWAASYTEGKIERGAIPFWP